MCRWQEALRAHWHEIRFGDLAIHHDPQNWRFELPVYLGGVSPRAVWVQLYANSSGHGKPIYQVMERNKPIAGTINGYLYQAIVPAERPATDYTPRLIPYHSDDA